MRKEVKKYTTVCDSCETELYDSGVRSNGGRFEEPYLKHGEIDLCYTCAGKIFYRDIIKKIPEDKLQEFINSLKKAESSNPLGPDLELVELDLGKIKESMEPIDNRLYNISKNSVPEKNLSSLDEVKTLDEL
jgi:hypothetical protein